MSCGAKRRQLNAVLAKQTIIVGMTADPEPDESVGRLDSQGSIVSADPCGPEAADLLELKRRMPGILFQARVGLIGEIAHLGRKGPI